ncbi:MAG TPA: hypothetical protein VN828_09505 [Acidobacteriaceae bacterium]|nr:hypothetical protein [Acidobacteriaceae bacterium]
MSSHGLINHDRQLAPVTVRDGVRAATTFIDGPRETRLLSGNGALRLHLPEILELRRRCGQEEDLTTEPEYFMAANTLANRRCSAVLIRRDRELEACVLFYEHTRLGIGIGLFRGGDYIGESLVVGREPLRATYVHLATQALLKKWRIHGVSLTIKAPTGRCTEIMGPASDFRRYRSSEVQHKLPLESTYEAMLARLGPRTRRSLAGKRQQLEKSANVKFVPVLEPDKALEVMLELEGKSMPRRIPAFFHARYHLLRANSDFFSMGLQLPGGPWLSLLSGWRRHGVTYIDLQMNDMHHKKESLSAVMRAFMLEHEIAHRQQLINFVGGSSLLLRRYCEPLEPCTDFFVAKPGFRSDFFEMLARHVRSGSVYERLKCDTEAGTPSEGES